jgi:hypothetical protein
MNPHRFTPAEDTAAILQEAAHGGLPVMIPGAFDIRDRHPRTEPTMATPERVTPHSRTDSVYDLQQLEYEREGGGAPSERPHRPHRTILASLWHGVLHSADLWAGWLHPLPRQR